MMLKLSQEQPKQDIQFLLPFARKLLGYVAVVILEVTERLLDRDELRDSLK